MPDPETGSPRRMRIAYIMSRFPTLTETFILNEMLAMESMGVDVELYPLLRERQTVLHPDTERWMRRAHYHSFISWPIVRANLHFLRHRPRTYLCLWSEVLGKTWGSANFFIGALGIFPKSVRFAYEMQRCGVEHVHAHFATHPTVAALIIHRLTGIPFSFTGHGSDVHVERRMLDTKVEAATFAVAVSEFNRGLMLDECGPEAAPKIHILHCGVDTDTFSPGPRPRNGRPLRIVCVAALDEPKGHTYLIEACRMLHERGMAFRCHLIGEGPFRREIEACIAHAELRGRVHLHGGLPAPSVASMLRRADVAVLASQPVNNRFEGIPVALMEAMSCALPVVATSVGGIPELVEHERTGLVVPPGDAAAIADALQRMADDRTLREEFGRCGRERVLSEFDLHANARKLFQMITGPRAIGAAEPAEAAELDATPAVARGSRGG